MSFISTTIFQKIFNQINRDFQSNQSSFNVNSIRILTYSKYLVSSFVVDFQDPCTVVQVNDGRVKNVGNVTQYFSLVFVTSGVMGL